MNFFTKRVFLLNSALVIWSIYVLVLGLKLFKYSNAIIKYRLPQQYIISAIIACVFIFFRFAFKNKCKSLFFSIIACGFLLIGIISVHNLISALSVILIYVSAFCIGEYFLKDESLIKPMILGLAIIMAFMNVFSHSTYNFSFVYLALLIFPIIYRYKSIKLPKYDSFEPSDLYYFTISLFFIIIAPTVINCLRPEIGFDAMAYQILAPYRLKQYGEYSFDPSVNSMALMPQGINWLYTIGLTLGGEIGMRLLVVTLGVLTSLLCIEVGIKLKLPNEGLLAAVGLVSYPVFEMSSGYTFVENGVLIFTVGSGLLGLLASYTKNSRYLLSAVFILISTLATKQNSVLWVLFFGAGILYLCYKMALLEKKLFKKVALVIFLGFIFFIIPTYGYAFWKSGNPFFPFFNGIFKSPFYEPVSFNNTLFNHPYRWDLFFDMTRHSNKYLESDNGSSGVLLLFLFPLTFYWMFRKKLSWQSFCLGWAPWCYFFVTFHFQSYLRYLYPVLPLIFFGFAYAISEVRNSSTRKIWMSSALACCFVGFLLRGTTTFAQDYEINKEWFWGNNEPLINSMNDERNINNYMNKKYNDNCTLVHINRPFNAFLNCKYYANSWHSWVFSSQLEKSTNADQVHDVLVKFNVSHVSLYLKGFPGPAWGDELIKKYLIPEYQANDLVLYKLKGSQSE